jgi:4,5-DOPA dioxygenase extradiol
MDYPAPGAPDAAAEVSPTWVGLDQDSRGIDHGTWSVLVHAFPDASIPVVALSAHADKALDHHLDLGAQLAALRRSAVLVVATGNVVHHLCGMDPRRPDDRLDWARRFDDSAREVMLGAPETAAGLRDHRDFPDAASTPDHFLLLLYLAGLAGAEGFRRGARGRLRVRVTVDGLLRARPAGGPRSAGYRDRIAARGTAGRSTEAGSNL